MVAPDDRTMCEFCRGVVVVRRAWFFASGAECNARVFAVVVFIYLDGGRASRAMQWRKTSRIITGRAIHFDAATVAALSASRSREGIFFYFECKIPYTCL